MTRRGPLLPGLLIELALLPPALIALVFLAVLARGAYHGGRAAQETDLIQLLAVLAVSGVLTAIVVLLILALWARLRGE